MKRWMQLAVGLYPLAWRRRYGAEFCALIEDAGPGWRDFWDVVRGALVMQMKSWRFLKVTAACGLAGLIIASLVASRMEDRYVSDTVLRMSTPDGQKADGRVLAERLQQLQVDLLSRKSLADIIHNHDLYKRERQRLPLEDIVQTMQRKDIRITPLARVGMANAFQVQFTYPDPGRAQAVTTALVARMMELNLAGGRTVGLPGSNLEVLDPANLPQKPVYPNRLAIAGLGLAGGLALGLVFLGIRRWAPAPR